MNHFTDPLSEHINAVMNFEPNNKTPSITPISQNYDWKIQNIK